MRPALPEHSSGRQDPVLVQPLRVVPLDIRNIFDVGIACISVVQLVSFLLQILDEEQEGTLWSICDKCTSLVSRYRLMVHRQGIHRGISSSWHWEVLVTNSKYKTNLRIPWTVCTTAMFTACTGLCSCNVQQFTFTACSTNPLPWRLPHKWLSILFGIRPRQFRVLLLQAPPRIRLDDIFLGIICLFRLALPLGFLRWVSWTL